MTENVFSQALAEGLASVGVPPSLIKVVMNTFGLGLDPSARVFLPSLLVAALLAWRVRRRRPEGARGAFARRSKTSRVDFGLLLLNGTVAALFVLPWGLSTTYIAMKTVILLDDHCSAPLWATEYSDSVVLVSYSITLFLAWDFSRYVLHRAMHTLPWLWSFHQVHHSANALSPATLYRVHPVERLLFAARGLVVTGVLAGVFFFLFQARAIEAEILGVSAVGFLFNLLGGNLRHSHIWLGYGVLEKFLISPAQHQMHHSNDAGFQQSNYGTWLALWDRLGSTWVQSGDAAPAQFGLVPADHNHRPDSLISALLRPFRFWSK